MTSIGTALISQLSHSDTEKLFIPWWDNLEDFVIYGLITLGLIVLPTQVFSGTPLFCTACLEVNYLFMISFLICIISAGESMWSQHHLHQGSGLPSMVCEELLHSARGQSVHSLLPLHPPLHAHGFVGHREVLQQTLQLQLSDRRTLCTVECCQESRD